MNRSNDIYNYSYRRDKYGFKLVAGIFFLICLISALSLFVTDALINLGWIGFFVFATILAVVLVAVINHIFRKIGYFTINEKEINITGQTYDLQNVRRLAIVLPTGQIYRSSNVQRGTVIIGGPAIAVGATVVAHQAANATKEILTGVFSLIQDGIREVNVKITFQYGNQEIKLAGGMSERNATYLYDHLIDHMK